MNKGRADDGHQEGKGTSAASAARNAASGASEAAPAAAPPPFTNRGVRNAQTIDIPSIGKSISPFRFDYYRASISELPREALDAFKLLLPPKFGSVKTVDRPAVRFYSEGAGLTDEADNLLVTVLWGGQNAQTNVMASGGSSDAIASIMRAEFAHRPSRVDSCIDVAQEGLFAHLLEMTRPFAKGAGIHRNVIANDHPDKGDTIYLGSRTSQAFVRIYQMGLKRAQEESRNGPDILEIERDAVRVELEFKPSTDKGKLFASKAPPEDFWGTSRWTRILAREVLDCEPEPVKIGLRKLSDLDLALGHMGRQYARHLEALLVKHEGDVEAFGWDILRRAGIAKG